jgi:micrococcal nuclease
MWEYRCRVLDIYDGDTFTLLVDLGFKTTHKVRIRLLDIDTPEVRGEEREWGLRAKAEAVDWLTERVEGEWPFIVRTEKTGKYGRWIGDIRSAHDDIWITDHLKAEGFDTEDWKNW